MAEHETAAVATTMPLVSVTITTFNRSKMLVERAIAGILSQTLTDWECIVVDGGGSDDTQQVVEAIAATDPRFRYLRQPRNLGQNADRNLGIKNSRGKYIVLTDDDDEFLPRYFEAAVEAFDKLPENVAYLTGSIIVRDAEGRESYVVPTWDPFWKYALGNGCFFRRAPFFKDGIFMEEGLVGFEDIEFHIRFYQAGYRGYVIPEPLRVYYTSIGSNVHSISKNYDRQAGDFKKFFGAHHAVYEEAGGDALEWVYRFAGIVNLQAGHMKAGRAFLKKSFRAKPTWLVFIYICASFFGWRFFATFDYYKSKIMRVVRINLLNRK
jgi:glycosyltransferase involved in cell wall biosynthesis